MESLTSIEAASLLGVNVQKFHRLTAANGVSPILEAPGLRGAKFWHPLDIDALRRRLDAEAVA